MPSILCFGDSNTYGYYPNGMSGDRYPADVRWTGILESKGFTVIDEGMCGRSVPVDPRLVESFFERWEKLDPPDIFMIMLGGNDLLHDESVTPEEVGNRMDGFLSELPRLSWYDPSHTLLVAPVPMVEGAWVFDDELIEKSGRLGKNYERLAAKHGIAFADAAAWGVKKVFDGVHFSEEGHGAFAKGLLDVPLVKKVLAEG